jgi:hypothetical protein
MGMVLRALRSQAVCHNMDCEVATSWSIKPNRNQRLCVGRLKFVGTEKVNPESVIDKHTSKKRGGVRKFRC